MSETRIPADEFKLSWAELRKVLDKGKRVQREVALHGPPVDYAFFDEVDDAPAVYAYAYSISSEQAWQEHSF